MYYLLLPYHWDIYVKVAWRSGVGGGLNLSWGKEALGVRGFEPRRREWIFFHFQSF